MNADETHHILVQEPIGWIPSKVYENLSGEDSKHHAGHVEANGRRAVGAVERRFGNPGRHQEQCEGQDLRGLHSQMSYSTPI